ncbi:hypothetical protein EDM80_13960 [bacterium]|nr:MAG: hypothetical protein EDM80_13960 [bacterium]RIK63026.1 MAG: hypothetical protein DCC64_08140 [Planctomycetota bacterium]
MGIGDWLGVLLLRRGAIERALTARGLLGLGLLLVASAALAREYDAEFIPHNPVVLALPFVASAAAAFLLFVVLWLAAVRKGWPGAAFREGFWPAFGRFLGVFWLTAPMAWFYGIPFERLLPPLAAAESNLWVLGLVALWRVAVMVRVAQVMFGFSMYQALVLVLFFGDFAVLGVVFFAPWPVMEIMGGVRGDVEELLSTVRIMLGFFGALVFLLLLVPFFTTLIARGVAGECRAPRAMVLREEVQTAAGLWATALAALLAWSALLPFTQPPLKGSGRRTSLLAQSPSPDNATGCAGVGASVAASGSATRYLGRQGGRGDSESAPARWNPVPAQLRW